MLFFVAYLVEIAVRFVFGASVSGVVSIIVLYVCFYLIVYLQYGIDKHTKILMFLILHFTFVVLLNVIFRFITKIAFRT